jgi:type IV pilus modification protein PilV
MLAFRRRLAVDDESGFTIAEVLVAMIVIAIGLLGLMAVQARSLSTVALSKERQTATALANRAMEQLRAVPYTALQGGLRCSELVGDPNLNVTNPAGSCTATFSPSYDTSIAAETVVTTTGAQVAPLTPHQPADTVINAATYRVRTYVTRVSTDPTVDSGYWLTVISTWTSSNSRSATKSVALRSQVYSPSGCLSPTTHPFSGPCQAFLYSNAGSVGGSLTVDGNRGTGVALVDGMTVTSGSVALGDVSARTQYEQSLSTQSSFLTAQAKLVDASTAQSGGVGGSSSADTDPATGNVTTPAAATTGTQSASTLSSSGGGSRLDVTAANGESGSAFATTVAAASPTCADDNGSAISGGQNCASASLTPGGTSSLALSLNSLGARGITLADLSAAASPSRAFGGRFPAPLAAPAHCTTTSGAGCVGAGVHRYLGTAHAGGFATRNAGEKIVDTANVDRSATIGSNSLVTVTSYADSASAESGISPGAATAARTGTLAYWNGTGFTSVNLATAGSATYTIPQLTGQYSGTNIVVSGSVVVTAPSTPATGSTPCVTAACGVKAGSGSVLVTLTYTVFNGVTQVGGFTVKLDLGSALAQTTYKGAPSA